jgi:D-3-phosphoglycerate dehydrogenase
VNTIDVKTASSLGVAVTNCPGKNSIAVAELVFALLLSIDRRIVENTNSLRAQKWNKKEFSKADGVYGKTIGIIGVGSIGVEVAKRAIAFGMKVIGFDPFLTADRAKALGIEVTTNVDDIFRRCDVVTLHTDLRPETRKLVNAARLGMMKPNAILLNASRGEVVDQAALLAALQAKKIRAGLDVFDPEPADATADFNDAILGLPNMIGTHHIGASTDQAQEAIAQEAFRMLEAFVKKGEVLNCVNKDAVKAKA